MIPILTILFGLFLAYANGANDNFKGVATLFGSGTTEYRSTLRWATVTTFLGSAMAWVLAKGLLVTFTVRGWSRSKRQIDGNHLRRNYTR